MPPVIYGTNQNQFALIAIHMKIQYVCFAIVRYTPCQIVVVITKF